VEATGAASETLVREDRERQRFGRRPRAAIAAGTIALLALLACGALGFLLLSERSEHSETRNELRDSRNEEVRLERVNASLDDELARTQTLATRRAVVLRRARTVLRGVDPVLTSVDELQSITGDIQEARDVFASDSSELVDELILLGNYLIDTPSYAIDSSYVSSLVDEINEKIDAVRADAYSLDGYDSSHERASRRFDSRASAFVTAVRGLEKQLKEVGTEE
jgi:hypothetical protein